MKTILAGILAFLGPIPGAVQGVISFPELKRSLLHALGASTFIGLAVAVLTSLSHDSGAIFTSATFAAVASYGFTFLSDQLRRLGDGQTHDDPAIKIRANPLDIIEAHRFGILSKAEARASFRLHSPTSTGF